MRMLDSSHEREPQRRRRAASRSRFSAAALVVLGVLQYRWIGEMADAERQRMSAGIEFAAHHYSDDFDHELTRIFFAFQMPLPEATAEHCCAVTTNGRHRRAIRAS